jgi:cysteine synthase
MNFLVAIEDAPLIKLSHIVPQSSVEDWIKYKGNNPTISYKVLLVLIVIKGAIQRCDFKIRVMK